MSKLTHTARAVLPPSDFALPPKGYPMEDKAHARDALSRGAANASPAQLATIKRRVHAKFPSIKIGGEAGK